MRATSRRDLNAEVVRESVIGTQIAMRLRTTYEASSSDGGDDAFVQHVQGVLGGDRWCAGESAWYMEELASSAASAEVIGGRDASRGFALLGANEAPPMVAPMAVCRGVWWCASWRIGAWRCSGSCGVCASSRRGDLLVQLTVHHVAFDGGSSGVFLSELLMYEHMRARRRGRRRFAAATIRRMRVDRVRLVVRWCLERCGLSTSTTRCGSSALSPHLVSQRAYWMLLREGDLPVRAC